MSRIDEARSMLKDVDLNGANVVLTKKILWMLGKSYDVPSAWSALLDEWEEMGYSRGSLHGCEIEDVIVLTKATALQPVMQWARE